MQAPSCSTLPLGGETASLAVQNIGAMCYRTTGRSLPLLHLYGSATHALVTGRAIVSHLHRVPTVGMDQCRLAMHVAWSPDSIAFTSIKWAVPSVSISPVGCSTWAAVTRLSMWWGLPSYADRHWPAMPFRNDATPIPGGSPVI